MDVRAATTSSPKNNTAHNCGNGSSIKICGSVTKINVVPCVEPSMPNDYTAGKMMRPISTAPINTSIDTVVAVRGKLVDLGK